MRAASIRNAARMHGKVPGNPARGEAQGRIGVRPRWPHVGPQTGVEAQKSKPQIRTIGRLFRPLVFTNRRSVIPAKINRDAEEPARTTRGPGQAEMSLCNVAVVPDFGEPSRTA